MNYVKNAALDIKILIVVIVVWLVRFLAPKSVLVLLFSIDFHLREGPFYPLMTLIIINLIMTLFILLMLTFVTILADTILMFFTRDDFVTSLQTKINSVFEFLISLSGPLSTWLLIFVGIDTLLRGANALNHIFFILSSNVNQLKHPCALLFILYVIYSLNHRVLKLDLVNLMFSLSEEE